MNGAAYSWIKDIETDGSKNTWAGRHIHLQNAVYRAEVRGSYVHNSSNYYQGANAYGIIYSGSECLIEDNIVRELNKPVLGETSGGGNVIAYNYVDEAVIESLTNYWQETAINMSHGSFCHSDLFEGNHTPNVGVDSTHGNNGWGVFFRNWATGRNSSGYANTYLRAIYVDGWNREMTSVGNVLGSPTFRPDYLILSPATGVNPVYGGVSSIYLLGTNAWELGTGRKPGAAYMDDGQAERLFYRHLDFDYKTKSQYVNPSKPGDDAPRLAVPHRQARLLRLAALALGRPRRRHRRRPRQDPPRQGPLRRHGGCGPLTSRRTPRCRRAGRYRLGNRRRLPV